MPRGKKKKRVVEISPPPVRGRKTRRRAISHSPVRSPISPSSPESTHSEEAEMANQNNRNVSDYATPKLDGLQHSIRRPSIQANNFEIKPATIQLLQANGQFGGSPIEDPNNHILNFLENCDTFKHNGVSDDAIRMRLFPFSLRDKAKVWLQSLPEGSITTWEELAQQFLTKYFPPGKTAKMRNDITSFVLLDNESLYEAWERFKELLRKCPHHGLPKWLQVQTFYNGLSSEIRTSIDAAAGGALMSKPVDAAYTLLETMSSNNHQWHSDRHVHARVAGVQDSDMVASLSSQIVVLTKEVKSLGIQGAVKAGKDFWQSRSNDKRSQSNENENDEANQMNFRLVQEKSSRKVWISCSVSLSSSPSTAKSHRFRPLFTVFGHSSPFPSHSSPFSATLHRSPLTLHRFRPLFTVPLSLFTIFDHTITGHATTVTTRRHYLFRELRVGSCSSILHLFSNFLLVSIPSKVMSQRKKGSLTSSSKGGKRFADEKAQKCFRDLYSLSTTIISERGLLITEGLPAYGHLHYLINKIGWGDYVKPPPFQGIQGLVQEFYANLCSRDEDGKVFIRDRWFKISRDVIRELLFLPEIPTSECEYHRMTTQGLTEEEYDVVLRKLYNPEDWSKQWELHHRTKECLSLDMTYFEPTAKVWQQFIASHLLPSTHSSEVSKERAILNYYIHAHKKIDAAQIIFDQMMGVVDKHSVLSKPSLYFPCLITKIYNGLGVQWPKTYPLVQKSRPFTISSLRSGSKRRKRKSNSANESGSEPDDHFEELVQQEAGTSSSAPPQHTGVLDPWLREYLERQAAIQAANHQELLAMQAAHQQELCTRLDQISMAQNLVNGRMAYLEAQTQHLTACNGVIHQNFREFVKYTNGDKLDPHYQDLPPPPEH
ncbi:uncharacterized protein G2W53_037342 [Senna tora]|uniref:Retrotransposon gag domain-containing protein n=1 Tax=Senna tora TaxID=362788 RepID=A0A834T696_9FABA|nr:uncharacterized protein G2W53_037342 [Senna tora]